jgi:hypothetical protein
MRAGKFTRDEASASHRAVARAIYEAKAGTTCEQVATEIGVATSTVRRWKSEALSAGFPWRTQRRRLPELSGRAANIADRHQLVLAEMSTELSEAQKYGAERQVADMIAAEARAAVVTRHRSEWMAVRATLYKALQAGDATQARVARDLAEAMELMQKNERRAWGLDSEALGPGRESTVVIVDRGPSSERATNE